MTTSTPSAGPRWPQPLVHAWLRYRDRLSDACYVLPCLGWCAVLLAAGLAVEPAAMAVLAGLVVTATLPLRRRYPRAVALGGLLASATFFAAPVAAAAIYALAVRRRDLWLLAVCLLHWLALTVAIVIVYPDLAVGVVVMSGVGVGGSAAAGAFVGGRRDLLDSLRSRAERAEAENALRADQARLSERARIAQEMHDVLAHKISLVTLQAGGLEVRPDAGAPEVERVAGLIRVTAREALEDLRGVLGVLRGSDAPAGPATAGLRPQPTLAEVPDLVRSSRQAGVPVRLEWLVPDGVVLPDVMGRTAFRVTQEALTNVHKHARGTPATVRVVTVAGEHVEVVVHNRRPVAHDVRPLLPGSGAGLTGLAERVRLAGGVFSAGPTDDGFVVRAWLPWPRAAGAASRPVVATSARLDQDRYRGGRR